MLEEMVDKLEDLAEKFERYQWRDGDEQKATKYALVLPFLRILDYDVFNPEDVEPGYAPTDANGKQVGKVDYGLCPDSSVDILLHVTDQALWNSSRPPENLKSCYRASGAGIAILTNGLRYQVYTDLDEKGVLDSSPYLVFDLQKIAAGFYKEWTLQEVHRLSKLHFDIEKIRDRAQTLKIFQQSWWYMKRQLDNPSRSFIKFIQQQIGWNPRNEDEEEQFDKIVKYVLKRFEAEGTSRSSQTLQNDRSLSNGIDSFNEPEPARSGNPEALDGKEESKFRDTEDVGSEFKSQSAVEQSKASDSSEVEQSEASNQQEESLSESEPSEPSAPNRAPEQPTSAEPNASADAEPDSGSADSQAGRGTKNDQQRKTPRKTTGQQIEQHSVGEKSASSDREDQNVTKEDSNRKKQSVETDEQGSVEDDRILNARNDAGTEYLSKERIKKQRDLVNTNLDFNGKEQEGPDKEKNEKVKTVDGQGKNPLDTGFQIFQDIISDASNYKKIRIRENEGVLEMLVEDDPDKCVARLHDHGDSKVLGLFDAYHEEYQIPIKSLDDIYQFEDQIRIAAEEF